LPAVGAFAGGALLQNVAKELMRPAIKKHLLGGPELQQGDIIRLRKALGAEKIPIVHDSPLPGMEGSPHYMPPEGPKLSRTFGGKGSGPTFPKGTEEHGYIYVPKKTHAEILAHEMGHGTGLGKSKWYKYPAMAGRVFGGLLGLPAAAYMAYAGADPESSALGAAGSGALTGALTGAVASSPVLFEEARASYRALKGMKALGVPTSRLMKAVGRLGGAFGTYAFGATVPAAVWGATAGSYGRYKQQTEEREKAREERSEKLLGLMSKDSCARFLMYGN
jgi:hypothetical protein